MRFPWKPSSNLCFPFWIGYKLGDCLQSDARDRTCCRFKIEGRILNWSNFWFENVALGKKLNSKRGPKLNSSLPEWLMLFPNWNEFFFCHFFSPKPKSLIRSGSKIQFIRTTINWTRSLTFTLSWPPFQSLREGNLDSVGGNWRARLLKKFRCLYG